MPADPPTGPGDRAAIHARVEQGIRLRRELESQVRPQATSIDGRVFRFAAPLGLDLRPGGYVTLGVDGVEALGQIVAVDVEQRAGPEVAGGEAGDGTAFRTTIAVSNAEGWGELLEPTGPFHDAPLTPAPARRLEDFLSASGPPRARLEVGEALLAPGAALAFDAGGFARHTFLCGQSGCGKSYALGVVLEQLLLETDLRIVVLDPNSDFTRMRQVRTGVRGAPAARWRRAAAGVQVRRLGGRGAERLRLRFFGLPPRLQAAVAGLDPLADREEYGAMLDIVEREARGLTLDQLQALLRDGGPALQGLGRRLRNLGIQEWSVWSGRRDDPGLMAELDAEDWRCLVVDLGSIAHEPERDLVAAAVLTRLWARRADRRPLLIVVDEAHNVCPQRPERPLTTIATEIAINIAAEGRKYGLYLLIATQRPDKVHENVLTQCDNLMLMRLTSSADLGRIAGAFSSVPAELVHRASTMAPGEMLAAGRITPHPMFIRVGARVSAEGGSDVPSAWAAPRS